MPSDDAAGFFFGGASFRRISARWSFGLVRPGFVGAGCADFGLRAGLFAQCRAYSIGDDDSNVSAAPFRLANIAAGNSKNGKNV